MDGLFSDEELFLTQNSFSEERVEDNFSIDCILDAEIEGQFTNHSLRATTATRALKKGIPDKFVMQRTGHRDVRSLQKYQRPETSTKIEFSKAFDTSNEAVSLSGSIGSQKAPLKREVELEEETTRKFSKSCDEARIPETKAMTFNQCTFLISKD